MYCSYSTYRTYIKKWTNDALMCIQASSHIVNPVNVSGHRSKRYEVVVSFYLKYPSLF